MKTSTVLLSLGVLGAGWFIYSTTKAGKLKPAGALPPGAPPQMTGAFSVVKGLTYQLQVQNLGTSTATPDQILSDLNQQGWSPIMSTLTASTPGGGVFTVNATWSAPTGQVSREVSPLFNILNLTLAPSLPTALSTASSGSYGRGYSRYSSTFWPRS